MKQVTKESEFEPGVRELAPDEIEAVAGGSAPTLPSQPMPSSGG
jgi:hypothetical protein